VGYTIVDSLDSLLVLGFEEEYLRARDWVRDSLDFDKDAEFNTFEVSQLVHLTLLVGKLMSI
jgi:mannosyl-oligosaccharide alpha-1,2-mannosidase